MATELNVNALINIGKALYKTLHLLIYYLFIYFFFFKQYISTKWQGKQQQQQQQQNVPKIIFFPKGAIVAALDKFFSFHGKVGV